MKRSILVLLLLLAPTALPAQIILGSEVVYYSTELPTDPMTGTYQLPWEVHQHDGSGFSTLPLLSIPGQPPISALHKLDAPGAWLVSLSLPAQIILPPTLPPWIELRDVLIYIPGGGYNLFFCGGSVMPPLPANADVDAVYLLGGDAGDIVLSVDVPVELGPGNWILPADLVRYTRSGSGCSGWSYAGKEFDSAMAGAGIPSAANIVGATSYNGTLLFTVESPTLLAPSASVPAVYDTRDIVAWDGAMFDRAYGAGASPFLVAPPPNTVLTSLTVPEGTTAAAAAPGSDVMIFGDPDFDLLGMVVVTDVSGGSATSVVRRLWPQPWYPAAQIEGSIAVRSDYSRVYTLMDGPLEIRGIDPRTGAVMDTFASPVHGNGVDIITMPYDLAALASTSLGEIVSINLTLGPNFGLLTTVATGLADPQGIVVDATGTYAWVAERGASRIVRVELATGMITPVVTTSSPPREIDSFFDIFYYLYATLDNGDLVRVHADPMDPNFGTDVQVYIGLNDPGSVRIGSSGQDGVVVTERGTGRVLSINANPASPGYGTSTVLASINGIPAEVDLIRSPGFLMLPCPAAAPTGSTIATCAYAATGGDALGSYGATLTWDPTKLSFAGTGAGEPPWDTPVVNTTNVAAGTLSFADADATGAAGTSHLLCAQFNVIGARTGPGGTMPLNLHMTSAFDPNLTSLLPGAIVGDYPFDILQACTIGDPVEDTMTNSGDALAVLRREVWLPIPVAVENRMQAFCGDFNADGLTDSTDANIALSVEVGLPVNPLFPIGQSNVITETCGGGPCAGQPATLGAPKGGTLESALAGSVVARLRVESGKKILPGDTFDLVLEVDAGVHDLGSFAAVLSWSTEDAAMRSYSAGAGRPLGAPTFNDSEADTGRLRFAAASPTGASGTIELLRMTLTAGHALPHPERIFTLDFTSMAATGPSFESLLPVLEIDVPAGSKNRR